jgi:Holliday junction DNA helicase RuvA
MARDILSNIQPGPLAQALAQGDIGKLSAIPGIGRKTAERLVLELKDKACKLDMSSLPAAERRDIPADDVMEDVVSALLNLGYKESQVRKLIGSLDAAGGVSVEGLLKQALKILMK